jgi:hypothetical protein
LAPFQTRVFVLGTDDHVYIAWTNRGDFSDNLGWVDWNNPASDGFGTVRFVGDPAGASWDTTRADVFVADDQGRLWHKSWDAFLAGGVSHWEQLGTPSYTAIAPSPDAAGLGTNRYVLSVRQGASTMQETWDFTGFGPWYDLGGAEVGAVSTRASW